MNDLTFGGVLLMIVSLLLLPVNLYCAFWLVREALNLSGMTVKEFLSFTSQVSIPSSHSRDANRRRQAFLVRFFQETSSDPQRAIRLLWTFGLCTLPGLAALCLAQYLVFHPDRTLHVLIGNLLLVLINFGISYAGRIYRNTHPLDAKTAEKLTAKRNKENRKPHTKDIIVYTAVGAFFFLILLGFHLGASKTVGIRNASAWSVEQSDVYPVLEQHGFETADIPTTFWEYDEEKLRHVCAGVKSDTKFEFYEYTDGETTDLVYNQITYTLAPDLEPQKRDAYEVELPEGNRLFTIRIDGEYHLALYRDNTVVYAHSPDSLQEINDILLELGYLINES